MHAQAHPKCPGTVCAQGARYGQGRRLVLPGYNYSRLRVRWLVWLGSRSRPAPGPWIGPGAGRAAPPLMIQNT